MGWRRENRERGGQEEALKGLTASEQEEMAKRIEEGSVSHSGRVQDKKDRNTSKEIRDATAEFVGGASNSTPLHCKAKSLCKSRKTPQSATCADSKDVSAVFRDRGVAAASVTSASVTSADTWYTATSRGFSQRSNLSSDHFYKPKEGVTTRSMKRGRAESPRAKLLKNKTHPSQSVNTNDESKKLLYLASSIGKGSCSSSNTSSNNCSSINSSKYGTVPLACTGTSQFTSPSADSQVSACNSEDNCSAITITAAARHGPFLMPFLDLSAVLFPPLCSSGCAGASFTARVRLEAAHKLLGECVLGQDGAHLCILPAASNR